MAKQSGNLSLSERISDPVLRKATGDEVSSTDEDSTPGAIESYDEEEAEEEEEGSDMHYSEDEEASKLPKSNPGWADAMAKVLRTKKPKRKKSIILAKAKKMNTESKPKEEKLDFEIEGKAEEKPPAKSDAQDILPKKRTRTRPSILNRVKPNVLDKDREKRLNKIATKGVVQLFNAVRQQQKSLEVKLKEAGGSERKREKAMKSLDKRSFLDVLMGKALSQPVDNPVKAEPQLKDEEQEEDGATQPEWEVLRDDFLMGTPKLKDWDKQDTIKFEDEESDRDMSS